MVTVRQILAPSKYYSVFREYNHVHIDLLNQTADDSGIVYFFSIPSITSKNVYQVIIKIFNNNNNQKISITNNCQCKCNCDSFKYQHMVSLYRHDGLYGDVPIINKLPRKSGIITGCKHTALAVHELLLHYNNNLSYDKEY